MTLWEKTEGDPEFAFDVVVLLDDQIAFNRHVHALPAWRRARANLIIAVATTLPLTAIGVCCALVLLFQKSGIDLDEALGVDGRGSLFLAVFGSLALADAAYGIGLFWWRRHSLEASLRSRLAERPSIDATDPNLAERYTFAIHAMGFRASTDCAAHAYAWTVVQSLDETTEHIFLMVDTRIGYIVPKRELASATILALRQTKEAFDGAKLAQPRLGERPGSRAF